MFMLAFSRPNNWNDLNINSLVSQENTEWNSGELRHFMVVGLG